MTLVRGERRLLCADLVEMRWMRQNGTACSAEVLLEDISRDGACLQLEAEVPLGLRVSLHRGNVKLHGVVKYCVFREIGYFAGVHFDEDTKWTEGSFEPKHMLDPSSLTGTR